MSSFQTYYTGPACQTLPQSGWAALVGPSAEGAELKTNSGCQHTPGGECGGSRRGARLTERERESERDLGKERRKIITLGETQKVNRTECGHQSSVLAKHFLKIFIICSYFWLRWVFTAGHRVSLVTASGTTLRSSSRARGMRALIAAVHRLSCPVACGCFPDQGSNLCHCTGRQILNHWTIREVPQQNSGFPNSSKTTETKSSR